MFKKLSPDSYTVHVRTLGLHTDLAGGVGWQPNVNRNPRAMEQATRIFDQLGFVVMQGALTQGQCKTLSPISSKNSPLSPGQKKMFDTINGFMADCLPDTSVLRKTENANFAGRKQVVEPQGLCHLLPENAEYVYSAAVVQGELPITFRKAGMLARRQTVELAPSDMLLLHSPLGDEHKVLFPGEPSGRTVPRIAWAMYAL